MKNQVRERIRRKLLSMSPQDQALKSGLACRALIDLPEFRQARTVMLYMSIPFEVDTAVIARTAWDQGKTVLTAKLRPKARQLIAVRFGSLNEDFTIGTYGIREPRSDSPWPVEGIDFIVVPAMAYDRRGGRLGRGGGYYDRFLGQPGLRAVRCGLAFAEQVVDELPTAPHDQPVDIVVTDQEVLRFNR